MTGPLWRVQDRDGRGPWRPGFSDVWMTDATPTVGRAILQERGIKPIIARAHKAGLYLGCAFRPDRRQFWFGDGDLSLLQRLGFRIADVSTCDVLFESEQQALIGCRFPLKFLPDV
jgi:hypothetical protein